LAAVLLLVLGLSRGAAQAQEPGVRVYLGPIRSPAQEAGAEYAWRQTSGPAATLSDPHARRPFFAAREPGEYAFELIVRGGGGTADRQIVTVAVGGEKGEESAPVHSWTGEVDRSVTLDAARIGVAARPDSTYIWRQIAGPCTVTLAFEKDASPAKAYFTPPEPGRYVFGLLAGGRRGLSPVGRVAVAVAPRNRPPAVRAWAKEEAISLGSVAELLAQANDPEGNPVSYRWRQVAGPKAGAMDGLCGPRLRVRLDEEGLYAFSAVANDGRFDGEPAYVTIRALKRSESLRLERARREKELVGLIESSDAGLLVPRRSATRIRYSGPGRGG